MEVLNRHGQTNSGRRDKFARRARRAGYYLAVTLCLMSIFHSSLLVTSQPLRADELETVERAIAVLDAKGFGREAFLLRRVTVFRNSDNWLNALTDKDNAYAATNFPFNVVTLYPDFFRKATDDTERAMILLHEARHMQGANEPEAYGYVWRHRRQLGWTMLSHGTTESYVTIEILTREIAPELFACPDKIWNDCTETLPAERPTLARAE
ncbi:MAG TPA: hypothetical protein VIL74_00500 [Pyrinomonadaceae bacterium]|jgi:hypothetical protein